MRLLLNRICNKISGAEIYNIYLLQALKKCKDLEVIFSSDNPELNKRIDTLGFKTELIQTEVNEIGTKRQFLFAINALPNYLYDWAILLRKVGRVDCIVFESMTEKLFLTPFVWLFQQKVVWIEHGPLFITNRAWIIKKLYQLISKCTVKIICVSKATQGDLQQHGIVNTAVIYIGIDTSNFSQIKKRSSHKTIGFLGTISKVKGIYDFIEVARTLNKKNKTMRFLVVGNGEEIDNIKRKIEGLGLQDRFVFTGYAANAKKFLEKMDVLLFPTHHEEGFSISLLEALSMGIPIVAADKGGNREIVGKENGFTYNSKASVKKIAELVENALVHKKTLGIHARKAAERDFSLEKTGLRFYNFFKAAIA